MALKSPLLQGNARLQQASERPPSIAPLPALEPDTQAVQKIQQALVQLRFLPAAFGTGAAGGLDMAEQFGIFGPVTRDALVQFQKKAFPGVSGAWDGKAGMQTLAKLDAALMRPSPQPGPAPVIPPPGVELRVLNRLPGTPTWGTISPSSVLLGNTAQVQMQWVLNFTGDGSKGADVETWAYTLSKTPGKHVALARPNGLKKPAAYLIYFHHDHFEGGLLRGLGDYMVGRIQITRQLALSGKDVVVLVPEPGVGGGIELFNGSHGEATLLRALEEIRQDIGDTAAEPPPLLLATYSSGLRHVKTLLDKAPTLASRLKAIYDFDGKLVAIPKMQADFMACTDSRWQTLRYIGNPSPQLNKGESPEAYLGRTAAHSPPNTRHICLPIQRWKNHPELRSYNTPWGLAWWLHNYIPTCMLQHALENTRGL